MNFFIDELSKLAANALPNLSRVMPKKAILNSNYIKGPLNIMSPAKRKVEYIKRVGKGTIYHQPIPAPKVSTV